MLDAICHELRNWFVRSDNDKHFAQFTIKDNAISPEIDIAPNQYFRIVGSVFNDGVYKNDGSLVLTDETFDGAIWTMAVPREVVALCDEIAAWQNKYAAVSVSPYSSESFGGYSYSKGGGAGAGGWASAFRSRLNRWRKI